MVMNATVLYNDRLAPGYYRMGIAWKTPDVSPGQFAMLRVTEGLDPLLRRPFGIYDVIGSRPGKSSGTLRGDGIELVYRVVGRGTHIMSEKRPGEPVDVLGPLGQGFPPPNAPDDKIVLVGGGMGVVPLHLFAKTLTGATLLFGTRGEREAAIARAFSKDLDLKKLEIATEDGSTGRRGLATDLLVDELESGTVVYACGPPAMLKAVAGLALSRDALCYVSLERAMACGIGVCLGCAVKRKTSEETGVNTYGMVCSDGPVFNAEEIDWERF